MPDRSEMERDIRRLVLTARVSWRVRRRHYRIRPIVTWWR